MFEIYLLTLISIVAAQVSPGPNLFAVASISLTQGRTAGISAVCGLCSGMLFQAMATAYGLSRLLLAFPWCLVGLRFLGGMYLIWLAYKSMKSAIKNEPGVIHSEGKKLSKLQAYLRGLYVVLTNPKAIIFWAAVSTFLVGEGRDPSQVLLLGPAAAITGFLVYGMYVFIFSTNLAAKTYGKFSRSIELTFAAAFSLLGGKLVWDGIRELRNSES